MYRNLRRIDLLDERVKFKKSSRITLENAIHLTASCSFLQWLLRCQQEVRFFRLFLTVGTSVHQSSKEVIKKSQVFLKFCLLMEGFGATSGSGQIITHPNPGGPITFGS
jgi:hypothetical protein